MADTPNTPRPEFDLPPVIETLLGVQFQRLEKWGTPHFGLFWQRIRDEYPQFEVQAPLQQQVERFGAEDVAPKSLSLRLQQEPPLRCWFLNPTGGRLLQLQNGHFIHNWRLASEQDTYPRYDLTIRPQFETEWRRFCEFLASEQIPEPKITQSEVTYVNLIPRGQGWESAEDLPKVFPCWAGACSGDFLPTSESVVLHANYVLPNQRGRLHIEAGQAIRSDDAQECLQLKLTVRGRPASNSLPDLMDWFDLGREWVVRGFTDFTSAPMHKLWKRKR